MIAKMKTLLLITLFFSSIIVSQTISGKVTDKTDIIPFANVIVKNTTDNIITGTTSDDQGLFEVKVNQGTYTIEISYLGYKTWRKEVQLDENLNLGTILLEENEQALDEIIVKTEKRVLERKIDRLVFNVEKSIAAPDAPSQTHDDTERFFSPRSRAAAAAAAATVTTAAGAAAAAGARTIATAAAAAAAADCSSTATANCSATCATSTAHAAARATCAIAAYSTFLGT